MRSLLLPLIALFISGACTAQNISQTASRFLNTLSKEQQEKALYHYTDDERYNWHFIPKNDRKGITLNELNEQQKNAALNLMKTSLSEDAFKKVREIMQHELVLRAVENRADSDHYRDPGKYYFTLFDKPEDKSIWGWRLEGHHVSFNFSAKNNQLVAATPGFMGSNPAIVLSGPQKGQEILKEETDMGLAFLKTLDKDQLTKAVITDKAPADILTFANRKAMIENPQGIRYSDLTAAQKIQFIKLVELYIHRYTKLFAGEMLKELKAAGLDNLQFAWAGAQEKEIGKGTYYRIQGPTIIIEYDNTQNNANHVHSVLRDLKHDFGGDELLEHYKESHARN
jgi:hypothetical protein